MADHAQLMYEPASQCMSLYNIHDMHIAMYATWQPFHEIKLYILYIYAYPMSEDYRVNAFTYLTHAFRENGRMLHTYQKLHMAPEHQNALYTEIFGKKMSLSFA